MPSTDYSKLGRAELIRDLRKRDAEGRLGLVWERNDGEREKALNDDFVALGPRLRTLRRSRAVSQRPN